MYHYNMPQNSNRGNRGMRQVSIIAILLTLFAASPLYAVQAQRKVCASGRICPWQNETPRHTAVHAAGRFGFNCTAGSLPCCQYRPEPTRHHVTALVLSVPSFRQAPAVTGSLEVPQKRQPAGAPYILRRVSKEIPLYLKTLTLLC